MMRVLIGNTIFLARNASKSSNDSIGFLIDNNKLYMVDCESEFVRDNIFDQLLKCGWADLSDFAYFN